jgi:exonuclease V gamma subunit
VRLTGRFDLLDRTWLRAGYGALDAKRQLVTWIEHLSLCAAGHDVESLLVGRAARSHRKSGPPEVSALRFEAQDPRSAETHLAQLVSAYLSGFRQPLCFFPEASLAFASALFDAEVAELGVDPEADRAAWAQAGKCFESASGFVFVPPEVDQVFRGSPPLSGLTQDELAAFAAVSVDVFNPLLSGRQFLGSEAEVDG